MDVTNVSHVVAACYILCNICEMFNDSIPESWLSLIAEEDQDQPLLFRMTPPMRLMELSFVKGPRGRSMKTEFQLKIVNVMYGQQHHLNSAMFSGD